jgi:hypothetical protein
MREDELTGPPKTLSGCVVGFFDFIPLVGTTSP